MLGFRRLVITQAKTQNWLSRSIFLEAILNFKRPFDEWVPVKYLQYIT